MTNVQEIDIRVNTLEFYGEGTVTGTAQDLTAIWSSLAATDNLKTIVLHNTDSAAVYFGGNSSVTTANGIPIDGGESREIPIKDLKGQPIFLIGSGSQDVRLEVWR